MLGSIRPGAGDCSSFLFFTDGASESVDPADDVDAAARCINFIVRSLDETPLGVSGAMVI